MSLVIRNELGDTGAGWRRPFAGQPGEWECSCAVPGCCEVGYDDGECCGDPWPEPKVNPGYLRRCPDCWQERPA